MKFKMNLKIRYGIIDPVPFVNVMLLFVIFFILSAQFIGKAGAILDLPKVQYTDLYRGEAVTVKITGGKVFLNDEEIDINRFYDKLSESNPRLVAIKADKWVPYSLVMEVISIIKRAGAEQIAIVTEEKGK